MVFSRSSNDILAELENAQWKGSIGARNDLQYLLVISGNKQKKICKVLKKSGKFSFRFYLLFGDNSVCFYVFCRK